jgi:hypothetical protein
MISKRDLTQKLFSELSDTELKLEQFHKTIWTNPREKATGGFRLTEKGFDVLKNTLQYKCYEIEFPKDEEFMISNSTVIYLDRYIDSPYYLEKKSIWVFREKIAVELVLFSGDIAKFCNAKKAANRPL